MTAYRNYKHLIYRFILACCLVLLVSPSYAALGDQRFSISVALGVHRPALEDLNQGEFKSPLSGLATMVDFETDETSQQQIYFPNTLPELGFGGNAALELQWTLSEKYVFIFGASTWEGGSSSIRAGALAIQGVDSDVINVRSASLTYNEYYFGLRVNVISLPRRYKVFYRFTLNEIFDIDYRENLQFFYQNGPAEGVNKSIILETQATGVLALQLGIGGEYFLNKWLSIGVDASYLMGLKRAHLQEAREPRKNFLFSDNLSLWLPQRISPETGNLEYLSEEAANSNDYKPIKLNFDGWKIMIRMAAHY